MEGGVEREGLSDPDGEEEGGWDWKKGGEEGGEGEGRRGDDGGENTGLHTKTGTRKAVPHRSGLACESTFFSRSLKLTEAWLITGNFLDGSSEDGANPFSLSRPIQAQNIQDLMKLSLVQ